MRAGTKLIGSLVLLNLLLGTRSQEDRAFKNEWSGEVVRLKKSYHLQLSSNYPSSAWIFWRNDGKEDNPYLAVKRYSFDGAHYGTCEVPLNCSTYTLFYLTSLFSLDNDTEVCSVLKYQGSEIEYSGIYVINMTDCRLTSVESARDYHADYPIFAYDYHRSEFEVFHHADERKQRLCDGDVCRQSFDLARSHMSRPEPFELSRRDRPHLFYVDSVGRRSSDDGYYFVIQYGRLYYGGMYVVSTSSSGESLGSLDIYEGQCEQCAKDVSFDHNLFGTCFVAEKHPATVKCRQIDPRTKVLMNRTYDFAHKVHHLSMHNVRDGGYVLLVRYCVNEDCKKIRSHVTKASLDGVDYGRHVEFRVEQDSDCEEYPYKTTVGFFEQNGQVCMMYRCFENQDNKLYASHNVDVMCL
ncbi:hypothetical protein TSAR_009008 [Trichomalopsis sarcophagae]|uniref:Uncharacterized protein n=1 Tax=Trichomalopsis sarcophagae TaxID=543379 RepID=A0A232EW49_9HYME|nr:hypothetical protein TSAR_009008 [Trichomalopsis sarcophagae]